jgi:imidazolonepropionase-like amidohydrolase
MSSLLLQNCLIWHWTSYSSGRPEGLTRKGSLLINNGKFKKVFFEDEEEAVVDESFDLIVNMEGRLILPGLIG